jgi:hypothetical protein
MLQLVEVELATFGRLILVWWQAGKIRTKAGRLDGASGYAVMGVVAW